MSDGWDYPLLAAVEQFVRSEVNRRKMSPPTGGNPHVWPYVARVMKIITGMEYHHDRWRNRHQRHRDRVGEEQVAREIAGVDPARYQDAVDAVLSVAPDDRRVGPTSKVHPSPGDTGTGSVEVLDPHVLPSDWVDRLYDNAKEQARIRQEATKPVNVYNVRVAETLPIMFGWVADVHLLDAGTDHYLWDEDREIWYNEPGMYLGYGGDWANWFSPAVLPKAMPANVLPSDYAEMVVRRHLAKLQERKKGLFGVVGNHDEFPGATGWHPINAIYRDLGIPDLGPGGRVFIHLGSQQYQVDARHSFNFNSSLNDTNTMRQLWSQAGKPDMVALAHLHHPTLHHRTFDGQDTIWFRNGSYKRNDNYAKSKNFVHTQAEPPDQPGIILFPDKKKMIGFRNYRDGLVLLRALRAEYSRSVTVKQEVAATC